MLIANASASFTTTTAKEIQNEPLPLFIHNAKNI
jgi:hypothetical protein